ncbi:MAG: Transcriptional repressor NrdR [Candidatus Uhrbacteria bacterium GW2011_GWE2_40_58]|nr:MAG: Transcriptional repressor NrdR [Candidatus Uhrbacteria bacterium GW2011_GWF2_40_263]KKR67854.1 MAG: Transcriptional repressor NrdR [Candidatus Uhrbacteria bacterium GW2011_GWE2_40_58]OGL92562.1 MAG: transcriptional regulator NrdR [Candidatus Uhrbacteria bacterium RIFOXYA2_FULL_40_9]OGL96826.1 MAG: transcriptional regulator NrdR [Candidatus Uhrbacteria bacterium RIFOXYB2_FULL_41_18]HBK34916.1 transcriptional regulator NrdR [Candidatus Uhrbacteria bacterium]
MRCPICNHKDTKVIDSRMSSDGASVRRRRECDKCGFRFSTLEEVELLDITIIKRDGRRENYVREKLVRGLEKALEKRPYTDERFTQLVRKIERDIQKKKGGQLTSEEVGEMVMKHLQRFDTVAYIRFASVYRQFEDAKTFETELAKLSQKQTRSKEHQKKSSSKNGGI